MCKTTGDNEKNCKQTDPNDENIKLKRKRLNNERWQICGKAFMVIVVCTTLLLICFCDNSFLNKYVEHVHLFPSSLASIENNNFLILMEKNI